MDSNGFQRIPILRSDFLRSDFLRSDFEFFEQCMGCQIPQHNTTEGHEFIWPFLFCILLGNLGKTELGKLFQNFNWLKIRKDGSDFDDDWTKQIAALSAKIW